MRTTKKRRPSPDFDIALVMVAKRVNEGVNFRDAFKEIMGREPGGRDYREARKVGYNNENFRKMGKRTILR